MFCFFFLFFFVFLEGVGVRPFQEYFTYIEWEKTGELRKKNTWPSVSRTWLSRMWHKRGLNHSSEKPNELRVNSSIH